MKYLLAWNQWVTKVCDGLSDLINRVCAWVIEDHNRVARGGGGAGVRSRVQKRVCEQETKFCVGLGLLRKMKF